MVMQWKLKHQTAGIDRRATVKGNAMKAILMAALALAIVSGVSVASKAAWDTKQFWSDQAASGP